MMIKPELAENEEKVGIDGSLSELAFEDDE